MYTDIHTQTYVYYIYNIWSYLYMHTFTDLKIGLGCLAAISSLHLGLVEHDIHASGSGAEKKWLNELWQLWCMVDKWYTVDITN
jgi:hypothetical protein